MRRFRSSLVVRALVVLIVTILVLVLSAILLPPKGGKVWPSDGQEAPLRIPR